MTHKFSTVQLRENNANLLRSALRSLEAATTAQLSEMTGLSVATCGKIVAGMVRDGEAIQLELARPDGGRPPRLYAYNPMFSLSALILPKTEDGVTSIVHAIMDAKDNVVERDAVVVDRAGPVEIRRLLEEKLRRYPTIKAVAMSIPGLVRDGVVGFCDLPELVGVDIPAALSLPDGVALTLDNDMNLAALGYYQLEMRKGSVAYLLVPRKNCVGAGLVVDGRVIRGHTRFAGELSFIPFGFDRPTQFAGLAAREALGYAADLVTAIIGVLNPTALAIASDLLDDDALATLRARAARRIPPDHLPAFVRRHTLDDDCLAGLAIAAEANHGFIYNQIRQGV
jgi:hypothetical protein